MLGSSLPLEDVNSRSWVCLNANAPLSA
jgi:hypothetical protein